MGEVLSAQGQEMSAIKSNLAALSTQMAAMMAEAKKNRVSGYRASSQSPSHRRGDKQGCYHCGVLSKLCLVTRPPSKMAAINGHSFNIGPYGNNV
jgi:hypothetical protein